MDGSVSVLPSRPERAAKKKAMQTMVEKINQSEGQTNITDCKYYQRVSASPVTPKVEKQTKYSQPDIKRYFQSPAKEKQELQ